jgi:hypothetical protein
VHEIAKEVPMTIYCGVDFHARKQTICYCDSADGEVCLSELRHDRDDVRGFYAQFTGDVVVGLEAGGYSTWFVELMEGLGLKSSPATRLRSAAAPAARRTTGVTPS